MLHSVQTTHRSAHRSSRATLSPEAVHHRAIAPRPAEAALTVRHLELADDAAIHAILHHPDVLYWTVDLPFAQLDDTRQLLVQPQAGGYGLVVCDRTTAIGLLRLVVLPNPRVQHTGRIGPVAVHPLTIRAKGLGRRCLERR